MTTTTVVPDSTVATTGITVTGAASANAALADASDASFIDIAGLLSGNGSVTVGHGTFTLPTGALITSIVNNFRASGAFTFIGNPNSNNATGQLLDGNATNYTNNVTDNAGIQPSTQADVDGYQLRLTYGNTFPTRVYRSFVVFTYVLAPTTAVTGPTGALTSTSNPAVTWTHSPGDSAQTGQTKYQMRVFTAAQYSAGGFDPLTSGATYDSGIVASAAVSANTGVLVNSTTYRAYVRTAQTTNGIDQWAPMAFTGFSLALTTSDITSVVATSVSATGRNQIVVTRNGATPLWTSVEVQRTIDGGTTWTYVRGYTRFAPPSSPFTMFDYEAPNGTAATYRARATYQVTGLDVASAWVSSSAATWSSATDYWLKDPAIPGRNILLHVRGDTAMTRSRQQGRFMVIGRADPVVLSDVRQLSEGTLQLRTLTDAEAVALLLVTTTDVVLFQTPPANRAGSRYLAIGTLTEERVIVDVPNSPLRFWSFDYVEVAAPADTGIS